MSCYFGQRPLDSSDEKAGEASAHLTSLIPLTQEDWVGPPPWLDELGVRWWVQSSRRSLQQRGGRRCGGLNKSVPVVSLVITLVTVSVMMTIVIFSVIGLDIGDYGRSAGAVEGWVTLWPVMVVNLYVVAGLLWLAEQHRREAYDDVPGPIQQNDLVRALGLKPEGPGLLSNYNDRLWTQERLEAAEARRQLSPFGLRALSARTIVSERIDDLYAVLTDAIRYPDTDEVDRAIGDGMQAVVDGRILEEELDPFLQHLAANGTPEAIARTKAAYESRPTSEERTTAQWVLDEAVVRGQISPSAFVDRSERLVNVQTTSAIASVLEGLRQGPASR